MLCSRHLREWILSFTWRLTDRHTPNGTSVLPNNLVGTYNVFEASRREGVKRVIFASSNHATGGNYLDEPWSLVGTGQFDKLEVGNYPLVNEQTMIRPDGFYGVSKAFGEAIGSYYNDYHGVASIHLRIGWVISTDDPTFSPFALSLWLSHRDTAQIIQRSIDAPRGFALRHLLRNVRQHVEDLRHQPRQNRAGLLLQKMDRAASSPTGHRRSGISRSPGYLDHLSLPGSFNNL